ncbi:ABC transporter substrate-binding protein [Marinibaculum pumilum]|uniref:ABC transporter substrate-binding protein n=1 Tax=Marinibaculum pumilum TaxID=1766165 RepID=A0ABV7L1N7_9PROT
MRTGFTAGLLGGALSAALALSAGMAAAEPKYDQGASDTEIKVGQSVALSGPASVFGTYSHAWKAYFERLNDQGGINGRKVNLILLDNAYSPPKAIEATRKMVEEDGILAEVGTVGTVPNVATQKYLNGKGVPQLLISAGGSRFNDPENYPWTMSFYPPFEMEGAIYGAHVLQTNPDAKIAVLYQHDDYGKDYVKGLRAALGDKADEMIVAEASYQLTDPTVFSQITSLKQSGADTFMQFTTPKFAAQAIQRLDEIGWHPVHYVASPSTSIKAVLEPAGLDKSKDMMTATFVKEPSDPRWAGDADMKEYMALMKEYLPNENPGNSLAVSGYINAAMFEHVLREAGDNLTRENLMKVATSLDGVQVPMVVPGIKLRNDAKDFNAYKELQLRKFDGTSWVPQGELISDPTAAAMH